MLTLKVECEDGTQWNLGSDESWKLTTNGPIRANCEYDGEFYDARLDLAGWAEPGFDAAAWAAPQRGLAAPGGAWVSAHD